MTEAVNSVLLSDLTRILGDEKETRLRGLIQSGRIREISRGRVKLAEAVPAFFDDLRAALQAGSASASAERAREARADAAALNLAVRRRELIHRDELDAAVEHVAGVINASLAALPARVTREMFMRRRVDELVMRARVAIGQALSQAVQEIPDE